MERDVGGAAIAPRICYFGGYDPSYARNHFLRAALIAADAEVVQVRVPPEWPTWKKAPALIRDYWRYGRGCDALIVAEFNQSLMPLAWLLTRLHGQRLAFDMMISLWKANHERSRYRRGSLHDRLMWLLDRWTGWFSDIVITQNEVYAAMLANEIRLPRNEIAIAPLGADFSVFDVRAYPGTAVGPVLLVQFAGSFIPNHGLDVIVGAMTLLKNDERFRFRFVGDGEGKAKTVQVANERGLRAEFLQRCPFEEVPARIAEADIVLGMFGATEQANQALPFKVLQGLAMRKPVVAGDSQALREFFTPGEHLLLTPLGDPEALADALRLLAGDASLRERLARQGYERLRDRFSSERVGRDLLTDLGL